MALVAGICVGAAALARLVLTFVADPGLRRLCSKPWMRPVARRRAIASTTVVALLLAVGLGAPGALSHDWHHFISGAATPSGSNLRARLTNVSDDKRTALWKVALHGFESSPLHGHGAGTFQILWNRSRPNPTFTAKAHSLYLQALAELGAPGLIFLLVLVGSVLAGLAVRMRRSDRSLYGALLAAAVVWALHAGVDWDWEMPVVTLGFFAAAGAALSPRGKQLFVWTPGTATRAALALVCLGSMVVPVLIIGSQGHLDSARAALYKSRCATGITQATKSIDWLDIRPEPYEVLGFCDLERGLTGQGVMAMQQAVRADPESWEPYYTLAIAQAAAGIDPRRAAEHALQLNPLESLTREEVRRFRTSSRRTWISRSSIVRTAALSSTNLSIAPT